MDKTTTLPTRWRRALCGALVVAALTVQGVAQADPLVSSVQTQAHLEQMDIGKGYALGLTRFDLDAHTEVLGWQLSDTWYFGRQDGEDSGLTLVWQQKANQVSISKDGLRLTRRF